MKHAHALLVTVLGLAAATIFGCPSSNGDRFVPASGGSGAIARWATTSDGRVRVPLAAGLAWETRPSADMLLQAGAPEGPTFVIVAIIPAAPSPVARGTCAEAHRKQLMIAFAQKGIAMTSPEITMEPHKGEQMPRLHYAVPLEAAADATPASTLSSWGYLVDGERCLGIGVTTIVHAKAGTDDTPDPEDMQRLEHVFGLAIDGAELTRAVGPRHMLPMGG
ncbi:MAG: hypothetical protein ABI175_02665 [Polyangiales bacterium]